MQSVTKATPLEVDEDMATNPTPAPPALAFFNLHDRKGQKKNFKTKKMPEMKGGKFNCGGQVAFARRQ